MTLHTFVRHPCAVAVLIVPELLQVGVCAAEVNTFCCCFFEIGSHYRALAILEFSRYTRLALNLEQSACLCLSRAGIKCVPVLMA